MCRLLGYLGSAIQLDKLLYKPEHSLVTQSYQPREMTAGILNADGFGVGWFDLQKDIHPYIYKNILPIWNDVNLPPLSRYVESECILSYVRSATTPVAVDFSNCQPFNYDRILFIHNGFIHHFRQTLYRPIRNLLSDEAYHSITGTTDSEHIFALIISELQNSPDISLEFALNKALKQLNQLSEKLSTYFSANIILSDGKQLVACRYANRYPIPTLYWIKNQSPSPYPESVIVASEPLFEGNWQSCPENSIIKVGEDLIVDIYTAS